MLLSRKFVNDYTPLSNVDNETLSGSLLKLGNEVDSQGELCVHDNLVIGKVLECTPHPKSDHLKICKIDIKSEVLDIVCGAPNMKEGIKVIVALPGCVLPEGTIRQSKTITVKIPSGIDNGMRLRLSGNPRRRPSARPAGRH